MQHPPEIFVPGTVKPEADYEEFSRLGAKLGLPCPQAFVGLESRAADGTLHQEFNDRSRTLNRNYWNWLYKQFGGFINSAASFPTSIAMASDTVFGAGHLTNKDTSAGVTNTNVTNFLYPPAVHAIIGQANIGIVVGTGTTAESFEGVALDTKVANGVGAGQLSYIAATLAAPSYNAGTLTWTWVHTRIFNNNSGGTIVVAETGIYGDAVFGTYMIMRDKLGATVSVLNGGQLTVTYTFTLVFPA